MTPTSGCISGPVSGGAQQQRYSFGLHPKYIKQPRLLLIVPEHACRCGYSRCRGFIASKYASDAKGDGDEALYLPRLYYSLRSDVKNGFGQFLLSEALNLMTSVLAAWTLGASVIPKGVMRNLSFGMLLL